MLASRWLQRTEGHLRGFGYRLRGRTPDADAPDEVLANRARSQLGPVLHSAGTIAAG